VKSRYFDVQIIGAVIIFAFISTLAITAVCVAMGVVQLGLPIPQENFVRNVGYSIFAGGVIIVLVELPKIIREHVRENDE
jgi:hypothetical protein